MRVKSVVSGLSRKRGGIALLLGISTLLTGVERWLAPRSRTSKPAAAPACQTAEKRIRELGEHYFKISQTRSEVGFVYWVLQGFGCYDSFALFDTWREAMDGANQRLASPPVPVTVPEFQYALVQRH
jgi:hypothetical protein